MIDKMSRYWGVDLNPLFEEAQENPRFEITDKVIKEYIQETQAKEFFEWIPKHRTDEELDAEYQNWLANHPEANEKAQLTRSQSSL